MIIDLKRVMVDITKIEVITKSLNKYQSSGSEYIIQVNGQCHRIDNFDYGREKLVKEWIKIKEQGKEQ